jgi:hypothetical protein
LLLGSESCTFGDLFAEARATAFPPAPFPLGVLLAIPAVEFLDFFMPKQAYFLAPVIVFSSLP